jgi:hypothetical protein
LRRSLKLNFKHDTRIAMVVYGLLEGDFDDDYLSPTSPLAGRKKPDGTGNANDAAVGTASPGAPAAARSPRRESDVARIIRLAAVDAMMTGDRRKSSEDHRVRSYNRETLRS